MGLLDATSKPIKTDYLANPSLLRCGDVVPRPYDPLHPFD